jgi:hypothetical protein
MYRRLSAEGPVWHGMTRAKSADHRIQDFGMDRIWGTSHDIEDMGKPWGLEGDREQRGLARGACTLPTPYDWEHTSILKALWSRQADNPVS